MLASALLIVAAWGPGAFAGDPAIEARILVRTNEARAAAGLAPLAPDERLRAAARQHSQEMRALGYFGHTSPVASHASVGERAWIAGFSWLAIGENVFWAEGLDPRAADRAAKLAVDGWLRSPGHRANLLGEGFRQLGVGVAVQGKAFWATQVFGDDVAGGRSGDR